MVARANRSVSPAETRWNRPGFWILHRSRKEFLVKRFFLAASAAALGFAMLSFSQAQADGPSRGSHRQSGGSSQAGPMGGHREFKPSERFGYDRHGFKSYSWTHKRWSDYYYRYCYYAPSYGWCFYEPIHSCYLPISYYGEVYPESVPTLNSYSSAPTIQQQTTVVNVPSGPGVSLPEPPPIPRVAPAAVQKTNVGAGVP
jgi:hypothetical protein